MTHQIELRRVPDKKLYRGGRAIFVDGVRWGHTETRSLGPRGTCHEFRQGPIGHSIKEPVEGGEYTTDAKVYSQIGVEGEEAKKPLETRLLEKARDLVNTGKLRHPDAVKAEIEQRNRAHTKQLQQQRTAELIRFRKKAVKALEGTAAANMSEVVDKVVEAMKWAQTQ